MPEWLYWTFVAAVVVLFVLLGSYTTPKNGGGPR